MTTDQPSSEPAAENERQSSGAVKLLAVAILILAAAVVFLAVTLSHTHHHCYRSANNPFSNCSGGDNPFG